MEQKWLVALEISTSIAAIVTAGFVGWQAMLLNDNLKTPYLANLQERQIDACSLYRKSFGQYADREFSRTDGITDLTFFMQNNGLGIPENTDVSRSAWEELTTDNSSSDQRTQLIGAIEELEFFGQTVIKAPIESLRSSIEEIHRLSQKEDFFRIVDNLNQDPTSLDWPRSTGKSDPKSKERIEKNEKERTQLIEKTKTADKKIRNICQGFLNGEQGN